MNMTNGRKSGKKGSGNSGTNNEKTDNLDNNSGKLHVYKRRWVILALFALLTCRQGAVWNQWGPIAAVSEQVYGWTDGVIALFANWGPIMYIITALMWSWLLDTKGLRLAAVGAAGLNALGTGLRCLVKSTQTFTWLVHTCHILNGIAGPVALGGIPKISAVWFPPQERATATSIGYVLASLGVASTFLIGPLVVPEVLFDRNCTNTSSSVRDVHHLINTTLPCEDEVLDIQRENIMYYMYGTFTFSATLFLAMLIYFPNQPPKPPSPSASAPRLNYVRGLKQLFGKYRFWQIGFTYGVSVGTRNAWVSMLDVNLKSHGISQSDAGWLGFYGNLSGATAAILAGRFADHFQKRLKICLVVINIFILAGYTWLVLQILCYIPETKATLYAAYLLSAVNGGTLNPLFSELLCETAYPVSEGITNICMTTFNNIVILVFLGILSIPNIGTVWMNWLLVSTFTVAIILLVLLPEGHNRLDIDKNGTDKTGSSHQMEFSSHHRFGDGILSDDAVSEKKSETRNEAQ